MANGQTYSYNTGDLTVCADVLFNYLDTNPTVPWQDLRYIFGEIMYGGHITDPFDRRTCMTYLSVYIIPAMFESLQLAPGVKVNSPHVRAHVKWIRRSSRALIFTFTIGLARALSETDRNLSSRVSGFSIL